MSNDNRPVNREQCDMFRSKGYECYLCVYGPGFNSGGFLCPVKMELPLEYTDDEWRISEEKAWMNMNISD